MEIGIQTRRTNCLSPTTNLSRPPYAVDIDFDKASKGLAYKQEEEQRWYILLHLRGNSFKWQSVCQSQLQERATRETKDN